MRQRLRSAQRVPEASVAPAVRLQPVYWPDKADQDVPSPVSSARLALIRIVTVLAALIGIGYLTWRVVVTIPGATWWLAWPLVLLEAHSLLSFLLSAHLLWKPGSVLPPAPVQMSQLTVTVLVPTYNEPFEVLMPTVAAAVALRQASGVWVLDDGERPWVADMAAELGAEYRARPTHEHARAGNINSVLPDLSTDLVAVLDADHVVRRDFLANVLGYFEDPDLALVQTPQSFYNADSFEHVRWLGGRIYWEQDLFYRLLAESRNHWRAAFWCGTNAVLRLDALRAVGGVATDTVTEDIHTTIRLHRNGYRTIYHNEVLARGLAASNSEQYLTQRLRWGSGAMQVLRAENPLRQRELTWHQRLCYASTLGGWFDGWRILGFILVPILTLLTGAVPAAAPMTTYLLIFATALLAQSVAMQLMGRGRAPWLPSMLFSFIRMPASLTATLALVGIGTESFRVTGKGRAGDSRQRMRAPGLLVLLLALSAVAAAWYAGTILGFVAFDYRIPWVANAAAVCLVVNAALMWAAVHRIRSSRFSSDRRGAVRFAMHGTATAGDTELLVLDVSLTGARLVSASRIEPGAPVVLDLAPMLSEPLAAVVRSCRPGANAFRVGVEFAAMPTALQAHLALDLFQTGLTPSLRTEPALHESALSLADAQ